MRAIDVIVPIYNSLDHVRECLTSLIQYRRSGDRIILINDGSHPFVKDQLNQIVAEAVDVILVHKERNMGYLQAINTGIERIESPIVVLLNSDTIIFENFFEQVDSIFATYPDIGIINPVSVWANWTRIPFPSGQSIHSLNRLINENFEDQIVDIYNASGFCFAIRKDLLLSCGSLDLAFDPGYWEETDLCMKVLERNFRVVCAQGIFVHHHGWASFGEDSRNANMIRNEQIFRERWNDKYSALEHWFKFNNPLREQNIQLEELSSLKPNVTAVSNSNDNLSVLYVLPGMKHYGGVISVVQVVNRLVQEGLRANIAVYGKIDNSVLRYSACYIRPLEFQSESDFLINCPKVDVLVATHWSTVYPVAKAMFAGRCKSTAYFVQDFEPDFYENESDNYRLALLSYSLISNRICKTPWLKRKLDVFPGNTEIIPLGLNLDVFFDFGLPRRNQVVAMARPSSERRNWKVTKQVFEILRKIRPDIDCAVYGFGYSSEDLPQGIKDYGMLPDAKAVAGMLNENMILLDCSTYQGFGRPGLEAMACGTATVLTRNGGITAYAKHLHNCLLVDPYDINGIVKAIIDLFDDSEQRLKLIRQGQQTAERYNMRHEGQTTKHFLETLVELRQSPNNQSICHL